MFLTEIERGSVLVLLGGAAFLKKSSKLDIIFHKVNHTLHIFH